MTRPFRFGVGATSAGSRAEWVAKARRAEALGYHVFAMPDHVMRQFAVVPALMSAADATTRLRLSSFVFANDYRHPLVLAAEVATLDVLSGGRVEFGIGAGWRTRDYAQLGLAYDRPGGARRADAGGRPAAETAVPRGRRGLQRHLLQRQARASLAAPSSVRTRH